MVVGQIFSRETQVCAARAAAQPSTECMLPSTCCSCCCTQPTARELHRHSQDGCLRACCSAVIGAAAASQLRVSCRPSSTTGSRRLYSACWTTTLLQVRRPAKSISPCVCWCTSPCVEKRCQGLSSRHRVHPAGRPTPSIACVVQPGVSGGFQKVFFGREEIAIPLSSRCLKLLGTLHAHGIVCCWECNLLAQQQNSSSAGAPGAGLNLPGQLWNCGRA